MIRAKINDVITIGRRGVKIPVVAILRAIPRAIKAAKESAADNRDASSPGGAKVTAGEVAEDVAAFFAKLAQVVAPEIIELNTK